MSKLSNICHIATGKLNSNEAIEDGKYPFFTCGQFPLKINHYEFDENAILLAGNNANGIFHLNRYNGKFNAYQRTYILTTTNNNIDYIFYALKLILTNFTKNAQGSTTKFLTKQILDSFSIKLPSQELQQKIANLLSSLDKKIELNNKINEELEQMAKLLFDYWFVQFDFPDENGKPYKSSGGKMTYNPLLKREIPDGWEVTQLENLCSLTRGVTYPKNLAKDKPDYNLIPIFRANNIDNNKFNYNSLIYVPKNLVNTNQLLKAFDIVITMSSGSLQHIGKIAQIKKDTTISYGAFCNKITPNTEYEHFVYYLLSSNNFKTYIDNMCLGTNINNLTNEHINKYNTLSPTNKILSRFNQIIKPIAVKIGINEAENQQLAELRDWLLPMLMNGQVKIEG